MQWERIMQRVNTPYLCMAIMLACVSYGGTLHAQGLSGIYLGGSIGRERNEYDTAFVDDIYEHDAAEAGDKLKYTARSVNRLDNMWWAYAGYMFTPNVGIDAGFIHLGELTYLTSAKLESAAATRPVATNATLTSHGPALSLLLRLPLTESWEVNMRLGDYYGKSQLVTGLDFNSKYTASPHSSTGSSLLVTAGTAYGFAGHWTIRLDYLRVNQAGDGDTTGKYDVDAIAAGFTFVF
jgi:opacity protein-like surface antigen